MDIRVSFKECDCHHREIIVIRIFYEKETYIERGKLVVCQLPFSLIKVLLRGII